ncbi:type II toxin-antitoxin system prevent-host-death family antitoxin [Xylophilus rhododendri]|uniref:Antitoxin n=1 Tax=Xylophilus rhododendri TaxID=2697032 RepID=A0A857J8C3_9BURK|nr:type II toxin-antitoxin system Phd/YefM family antitoxin [Xylophilus rhododendri]QHI99262.1 type II toxin-antitoxin system prevent-host-death family antitoxin [Xylophilus rhododendri]
MLTLTATEARTRFGEFLHRAQREPIGVLKHGRMVGVMLSVQDFQDMRAFYAERLQYRLQDSANAAERAGLTPGAFVALLADES